MSNQDRQDYLDFMVSSAHKVLEEEGRTADADKMYHLFNDIAPGDDLPLGEAEMELNLAHERVHAAQKALDDPNAPPVQVETALLGTLMNNGIQITPDFFRSFVRWPAPSGRNTRTHRTGKKATSGKKGAKKAHKFPLPPINV